MHQDNMKNVFGLAAAYHVTYVLIQYNHVQTAIEAVKDITTLCAVTATNRSEPYPFSAVPDIVKLQNENEILDNVDVRELEKWFTDRFVNYVEFRLEAFKARKPFPVQGWIDHVESPDAQEELTRILRRIAKYTRAREFTIGDLMVPVQNFN